MPSEEPRLKATTSLIATVYNTREIFCKAMEAPGMPIATYSADNHNASENWVRLGYGKVLGNILWDS